MYTYEELKHFVDNCEQCPLAATRIKSVMGKGNLDSPIMFIAEAPGNSEDRDGIPFTGPSGRVFDELLGSMYSVSKIRNISFEAKGDRLSGQNRSAANH